VTPPAAILPPEKDAVQEPAPEPANKPASNAGTANLPGRRPVSDAGRSLTPAHMQEAAPPPAPKISVPPQTPSRPPGPSAEGATVPDKAQPAPASLREASAGMSMTILLYSEVKSERMAFINDRKYQEGDYIDGRYLLESITPEGALLSYQGERLLLHPKAK
jgi:hypothetical protein